MSGCRATCGNDGGSGALNSPALGLLPRQAIVAPAVFFVAMMVLAEVAIKTVHHDVDVGESGSFQRVPRIDGAVATAAD